MVTPLLEIVEVSRVLAPVATGTTEQFTSIVDAANCDGVLFVGSLGSPAANNIVRAQQDTDPAGATMADLEGSGKASGASNTFAIDVALPVERYLRLGIARGTTTTIEAVFAIKYNKAKQPTTQPSGTVGKAVAGAAEGTAGS
jgi:hypothetical protein